MYNLQERLNGHWDTLRPLYIYIYIGLVVEEREFKSDVTVSVGAKHRTDVSQHRALPTLLCGFVHQNKKAPAWKA